MTSSVCVLEVIEPGDGSGNNAHTFLITAMPFPSTATMFAIPTIWCFAFAGVATSGHTGSGPGIHEWILEMIKEEGGIVRHRTIQVKKDPLEVVFDQMNPVLEIRSPDQLVPIGRDYDEFSSRVHPASPLRNWVNVLWSFITVSKSSSSPW